MSGLRKARIEQTALYLGRGQSPSYVEAETNTFAINQKCIRDGAIDPVFARAHDSKVPVKSEAILQTGDICINSTGTGTAGRVGLWLNESEGLYFADSHVTIFRPHPEIFDSKYLATLLQTHGVQNDLETYCFSGSTNQVELNRSAVLKLELQFLSLPEQQLIAKILILIDHAIEQTEAHIAKQQRIKTGLMQDLLTKGIDEHGNIRSEATHEFKDSPLGRIPKEWNALPLNKIADLQVGYAFKSSWFSDDGIRLLRGENVGFGNPNWADIRFIPESIAKDYQEYSLSKNDLIIGMDRTFSKSGVKISKLEKEDVPSLLVQRVGKFMPLNCDALFLSFLVAHDEYHRSLLNHQKGMDIPHLSKLEILSPLVRVPLRTEQRRVAKRLLLLDDSIQSEQHNLAKLKKIKLGLMQDLLTGKVSVESLLAEREAVGCALP